MMPFEDLHQAREVEQRAAEWGFRRRRTLIPKGSRTAFRDDPEHHRSVATLVHRLCKKCSASSRETCPKRSEGRSWLRSKGCGERGGSPCPRPALERPGARLALRFAIDWIDQHFVFRVELSDGFHPARAYAEAALSRRL